MGGSFLNDLERIATREYAPTDEDVVRSRLRTLGVQEYKMTFDHGAFSHHSALIPSNPTPLQAQP